MPGLIDMTGKTVAGIKFIDRAANKGHITCWNCICHCGNHFIARVAYGGRGISVCKRWRGDIGSFIADMYPSYSEGLTIDRIDVNGNYSPDNCRWAAHEQQANNTRSNNRISWNGENLTISQRAERLGIGVTTLWNRQKAGWSNERIITEPLHNTGKYAVRHGQKPI